MFKGEESVVKNLTALGKSLILALCISSSAYAQDVFNPKFFDYTSNSIATRLVEFSFGWNKKLNDRQKDAYHQSIIHALEYAEIGDKVKWYRDDASGYSVPVMGWQSNSGHCRRLHLNVIAHSVQKAMAVTACYNNVDSNWTWYRE